MQLNTPAPMQLTYCTNIHAGETWPDVFASLKQVAPALKARLSPDAPFGLGLRLSNVASEQLIERSELCELGAWLHDHGLYVALINGFPFGAFHGQKVKDDVMRPDWRDPERLAYTLRLANILNYLLPDGMDGGISTSPLSYKPWFHPRTGDQLTADDWRLLKTNITWAACALWDLRQTSGKHIHLDIEPEPDGLLENTGETLAFFNNWLFTHGTRMAAQQCSQSEAEARQLLADHVQVCWDSCHFAIQYETAEYSLARFADAGIKIGRVQVSSALQADIPDDYDGRVLLGAQLAPFAENTYLHQTVARCWDDSLLRWPDLPLALPHIQQPDVEQWRIHYHVPLFIADYGPLQSTQAHTRDTLAGVRDTPTTQHLEIETYTWDVLPQALKLPIEDSIVREYDWVEQALSARR